MGKVLLAADKLGSLRMVDPHITALANGYRAPKLLGITKIYPIVPSPKEAGKYTNWAPDPYIDINRLKVGLGTKRLRIDVNNSSGTFATAQFEIEVAILDRELKEIIDDDRETYVEKKSLRGERVVQLGMEVAVATRLQNGANYASNYVSTLSGGNLFSDYTNSDPVSILSPMITRVALSCGLDEEDMGVYFSPIAWLTFKNHPKVLSRAVGTTGKEPSKGRVAEILNVRDVDKLASSYFVTIDETNIDNNVAARIWNDCVIICPPAPATSDPDTPLPGAVVRHTDFPEVEEYIDQTVGGGPATVKVTKDNWGITQISQKRVALFKNVTGLAEVS
ncbi:MAG TPA: hypothetical protein VLC46_20260 [Thermoanaerobaculia bacterium]|jgi:hypothetical protein|nr:hypothetical protein [Thermoanaerobaculia bacterium]